ncbi:MAG: SDR family NAD(P)-dependent oxidoreductase, partial [Planctomycetaceae bacterium]
MTNPTVQELFDLSGRVALVTGGTGFLGSAIAEALAEAGATVVVSSRERARAEAAAAKLPRAGNRQHIGVELDHMDEAMLHRGFDEAVSRAGRVDIVINNGHEALANDWTTVTYDQFARQLSNAAGYFTLARRLRDHVVERGAVGSVVMIGSMYGVVGSYPDAYAGVTSASPVAYHALKGGVVHLTRHLAVYWAQDRVRVNCLSPGPFPSEKAPREMVERLCRKSPMGRMGRPA